MCLPIDPICLIGKGTNLVASKVTNSFLDEVRKSAADATTTILKTLGTFWLNIPSPKVSNLPDSQLTGAAAPTNLQAAGPAGVLQGNLGYLTILAAVVGLIVCGARLGITGRSEHGSEAVKMLVRLIAVTAAGAGIVDILIKAGDVFSPWIISSATGAPFEQTAPSLLTNEGLLAMTPLLTIIVAIFALFGAGAMVIFMILRGALLIILIAVWPLSASLTSTEQGLQWYKKINAYLIAFVLLRPVASIIYAAGYLLIKDGHEFQTTDPGVSALMASLTGMAILAVAGLSLPALLRFVAPGDRGRVRCDDRCRGDGCCRRGRRGRGDDGRRSRGGRCRGRCRCWRCEWRWCVGGGVRVLRWSRIRCWRRWWRYRWWRYRGRRWRWSVRRHR